jgi:hypothetical protein
MSSLLVGYAFLHQHLQIPLPEPAKPAMVASVTRVQETLLDIRVPAHVAVEGDDILAHALFALKHEGTDLGILSYALLQVSAAQLEMALKASPSSAYLRVLAFLWEQFTGKVLDGTITVAGAYAKVFDPKRYLTGPHLSSARWRVHFNGLGDLFYCPVIRRTEEIEGWLARDLLSEAQQFFDATPRDLFDRALSWAYLNETDHTFALEGETPSADKTQAFINLLKQAHEPRSMTEDYLVELQNTVITNPFLLAACYRNEQNWLRGKGIRGPAGVTYVPPAPDDVEDLMVALLKLINTRSSEIPPLVLAAVASFGFVYIHPFMDGNGRLSRFLLHYVLAQSGQLGHGLLLPISIAMKRREVEYFAALQSFSRPARHLWRVTSRDDYQFDFSTLGDAKMYRYWDATEAVLFVFRMTEETLKQDLHAETLFLMRFDDAYRALDQALDIQQKDLVHLLTVCHQLNGRISLRWREKMAYRVPEDYFDQIEKIVRQCFEFPEPS